MSYVSSMLPVVLPIALFVVTLIIIFTLRASDKRSKSLSNVKKLLDIYKGNIEASDNSFKQYASELEQTVAKKDAEVRSLIQTVNSQLGELKSYSEDLVRLKNAMETYREALEGLARLTSDADDKVRLVQEEVDRLDKVRTVIDGFRQDMKDADEHLRKHEQRVIQLEKESIGRMNQAVSETDSSMDEAMASLHKESDEVFEEFKSRTTNDTEFRLRKLDDAFQAVIHTVQQFFGELENKIEEARTVAESLPSRDKSALSEDVPSAFDIETDEAPSDNAIPKTDLSAEIEQLSEPAPEPEKPMMNAFKAPKFTPKPDEEFEDRSVTPNLAPPVEDTYGDGVDETDDFASFGGVDDDAEESANDLRGMDIMDMDFNTFTEGVDNKRWSKQEGPADRWETYGDEETVDFDDDKG